MNRSQVLLAECSLEVFEDLDDLVVPAPELNETECGDRFAVGDIDSIAADAAKRVCVFGSEEALEVVIPVGIEASHELAE